MDKKLANLKTKLKDNKVWNEKRLEKVLEQEFSESFEDNIEAFAEELSADVESQANSLSFWAKIFKMGANGDKIRANVEARSETFEKSIEAKAMEVCKLVKQLDAIESGLSRKHPDLSWFNLFDEN